MHHRAEYLLQVLEKIGAPLLSSVIAVNARTGSNLNNEAQKIAELLAKTVQTSIDMTNALDLGPTGTMTDSIRIGMAGLAGPLVAGSFESSSRTPGDAEIKRIVAALQAVLTFAENFEANSENAGRLKNISAQGQNVDAAQSYIQYVQAFTPVINAANAFSFGQPEQKFVMDVTSKITARAKSSRENMFGDLSADNQRAELGLLKTFAEIYAACHVAETNRIQSLNDNDRAQMQSGFTTDVLWQNFDARVQLVESLAEAIVPGKSNSSQGKNSGSAQPAPPPVAPVQAPPVAPPVQTAAPPQQQNPSSGGNPMSFFKAPLKED